MRKFHVIMTELVTYQVEVEIPDDVDPECLEEAVEEAAEEAFVQTDDLNSLFLQCEDRQVQSYEEIKA